jgi:hypothetical protein
VSQIKKTDPLLRNSRREAIIIACCWITATIYSCTYCYLNGYNTPDRPKTIADVHPIFGIPSWVFWGYLIPWVVCAAFTFWFAGWYVQDDDLGKDHSDELEGDIREGGL